MLASLAQLRQALGRGLEVLDLGCGNGSALTRFLGYPGDQVLGIDPHGPSIEYATRHFANAGLEFRRQPAESLLAEGQSFDAILLADVLEHLPQPGSALATALRLLRPCGRILVTVPNGFGPFEIESWLSRLPVFGRASLWIVDHFVATLNRFVFKGAWTQVVTAPEVPYNAECGHVQFFTRGALLRMAAGFGLVPRRAAGVSWLSGPYTNYLLAPSRSFCAFNTRIADWFPSWMLSAWFFEFGRSEHGGRLQDGSGRPFATPPVG
jgi:SAM-dependent methyltransferase